MPRYGFVMYKIWNVCAKIVSFDNGDGYDYHVQFSFCEYLGLI